MSGGVPKGLCQCGCGRKTPIATRTTSRRGHVLGQPVRFCVGHGTRKPDTWVVEDRGYDTPCWIWQKCLHDGYGEYWPVNGQKSIRAHRWMWEQTHGALPDGLILDHLCRVRACVNPDHLEPVTSAENTRRGATAKLDWAKVAAIRAAEAPHYKIADQFGISKAQVSKILSGHAWAAPLET